MRPQLEKYLFEEIGIDNILEGHKLLTKLMMSKLKGKVDSPSVVNKALANEQKVIYKYKDIEEIVIKHLASENVIQRINNTEIMQLIA